MVKGRRMEKAPGLPAHVAVCNVRGRIAANNPFQTLTRATSYHVRLALRLAKDPRAPARLAAALHSEQLIHSRFRIVLVRLL